MGNRGRSLIEHRNDIHKWWDLSFDCTNLQLWTGQIAVSVTDRGIFLITPERDTAIDYRLSFPTPPTPTYLHTASRDFRLTEERFLAMSSWLFCPTNSSTSFSRWPGCVSRFDKSLSPATLSPARSVRGGHDLPLFVPIDDSVYY